MNQKIIKKLFKLAEKSYSENEFPVSAIIYDENGQIISSAYNKRNASQLTIDHAEITAITKANKKLKSWRLTNMCMVVTLEPCDMCKTVIKESRLKNAYYIIPRYNYKKQYKSTRTEQYKLESEEVTKYQKQIETFFTNKR